MRNPIGIVDWVERNAIIEDLLNQEDALTTHPMDQGFEAEVMKICLDKDSFVLKIWNKSSDPNISFQYSLLNVLFEQGLSVSKPVGWGITPNGDKVLLTTFDGMQVLNLNEKKIIEIANILSRIHKIHVKEMGNIQLPRYDFIEYFFPRVREHADIYNVLILIFQTIDVKQEHIIHGDYHLRNIMENNDRYTVIDWTNGQLGDPRYDFAWSLTLLKIYVSERYATVLHSAYLVENDIQPKELEVFEALTILRWLLLDRSGGVPKGPNTKEKVKGLITNNSFLKEFEITL